MHVPIVARKHRIKSHVYFSATCVAKNACVFLLVLMAIKMNVLATTIGRLKKEALNVLNIIIIIAYYS